MAFTNNDALGLLSEIKTIESEGKALPIKFAWALSRTKKKLTELMDSVKELNIPSEAYKKYDAATIALCNEMAARDEKGEPKIVSTPNGPSYDIVDRGLFDSKLKSLQDQHKQALEEQEAKAKEIMDLLNEECIIELYKVKSEFLPKEMPLAQLEIFAPMIED